MANAAYTSTIAGQVSTQRHDLVLDTGTSINLTGSSTLIDQITIDNTANSAITYLRLFNNATPTSGGNNPDIIFPCAASSTADYTIDPGVTFATALSVAVAQEAGTGGATAPSNSVTVVILTH